MIKISKFKKKNPNLKGKEFIDDFWYRKLSRLLFEATFIKSEKLSDFDVLNQLIKEISQLLIYKNIGFKKCTDCKKLYEECTCDYLEVDDFENIDDIINYIRKLIYKYENKERLELVRSYLLQFRNMYNDDFKKLIDSEIKRIDTHLDKLN